LELSMKDKGHPWTAKTMAAPEPLRHVFEALPASPGVMDE